MIVPKHYHDPESPAVFFSLFPDAHIHVVGWTCISLHMMNITSSLMMHSWRCSANSFSLVDQSQQ
jgi:hypothetical protein